MDRENQRYTIWHKNLARKNFDKLIIAFIGGTLREKGKLSEKFDKPLAILQICHHQTFIILPYLYTLTHCSTLITPYCHSIAVVQWCYTRCQGNVQGEWVTYFLQG